MLMKFSGQELLAWIILLLGTSTHSRFTQYDVIRWRTNTLLPFPGVNAFTTTPWGPFVSPVSHLVLSISVGRGILWMTTYETLGNGNVYTGIICCSSIPLSKKFGTTVQLCFFFFVRTHIDDLKRPQVFFTPC
uniref:Secreted protein n=1 Tax=Angiostrongylus cantonensis TaxID=6313 RepID=A0A0K0D5E0_ANGCA